MTEEEIFLSRIRAEPACEAHRLVFADWLDEKGRPLEAALRRAAFTGDGVWQTDRMYELGRRNGHFRYVRFPWEFRAECRVPAGDLDPFADEPCMNGVLKLAFCRSAAGWGVMDLRLATFSKEDETDTVIVTGGGLGKPAAFGGDFYTDPPKGEWVTEADRWPAEAAG